MSEEEMKVECNIHGTSDATFVCQHLPQGEKLGFHRGFDPDNPYALYPDAWCDKCDEVLEQEGGWNDTSESFAGIKLLCSGCYTNAKERNWAEDSEQVDELIRSSFEYLQSKQDSFMDEYKAGEHERWDWYQETGKLIFSHEENPVVECEVDFVGTVSTSSNTFMWAWANDSFTEIIKEKSRAIKSLGEQNNLMKLSSAIWPADEVDGWEMTGVMAKELNAIGAYRTASDNGFVYMTVKNASWLKPRNKFSLKSLFKGSK
jgi:hypothetical protein